MIFSRREQVKRGKMQKRPSFQPSEETEQWHGWIDEEELTTHDLFTHRTYTLWLKAKQQKELPQTRYRMSPLPKRTSFKEVTYQDLLGAWHTHWVYTEQKPLPSVFNHLTEQHKLLLNSQDYHIELSRKQLEEEIQEHTEKALAHAAQGYNPTFCKGTVAKEVSSPYGNTEISSYQENNAGIATSIGFRESMEDAHLITHFPICSKEGQKMATVSALFDGHGGKACAEHAQKVLVQHLQKRLTEPALDFCCWTLKLYHALAFALVDTDRIFEGLYEGTTVNLCLILEREIWIANLGDSRALFIGPKQIHQLSEDQKPWMSLHRKYIEGRGAYLAPTWMIAHPKSPYMVAPARGLGDHHLRGGSYSRPVITRFFLPNNLSYCYLLQGCDGLFDVASSEQVAALVRHQDKEGKTLAEIAHILAATAYRAGSLDNITIVLINLNLY